MPRPTFSALAISDRRTLGSDFPAWLGALAAAGVEALQLREKDLDDRALFALAQEARALLPPPGAACRPRPRRPDSECAS